MKLLNSLEFKSIVGGECVCHKPDGLVAAFEITDTGCARFCCDVAKGSFWRNAHWYRRNGKGNCLPNTEKNAPVAETEFVGPQLAVVEIKAILPDLVTTVMPTGSIL